MARVKLPPPESCLETNRSPVATGKKKSSVMSFVPVVVRFITFDSSITPELFCNSTSMSPTRELDIETEFNFVGVVQLNIK